MQQSQVSSTLNWYALYAKSRHEKVVVSSLSGKGYQCFTPTYTKVHTNSKRAELPLFAGYVFCRFDSSQTLPIVSTPGVVSILSSGTLPTPIADSEIEGLQRVLKASTSTRPHAYLQPQTEVCIPSGPLSGVRGVVITDDHEKWLVLSVHLLQRSIAAKVERQLLVPFVQN